jgi:vancomycin permeability regulator SanA
MMKYMGKRRLEVVLVTFLVLVAAEYLSVEWWVKWYEPRHTWEEQMKVQTNKVSRHETK